MRQNFREVNDRKKSAEFRFEANKQTEKNASKNKSVSDSSIANVTDVSSVAFHTWQSDQRESERSTLVHCCLTCLKAFDFFAILIGRRDKNHHCRCSHGCSARTLILACENINAIRSISSSDSISNAAYVRIANVKCAPETKSMWMREFKSTRCVLIALVCHIFYTHTKKMNALWFTLHIKNELNWKNG